MSNYIRNHKDVSVEFRWHIMHYIKLQMSDSISRRFDLIEMCASKSVWRNSKAHWKLDFLQSLQSLKHCYSLQSNIAKAEEEDE